MASLLPENSGIHRSDDLEGIEVSEINGALLMSLLEESPGDDNDDEGLKSVMQSLEAEISPIIMGNPDLGIKSKLVSEEEDNHKLFMMDQMEGNDCLESLDLNFGWVDIQTAPSSPSDDMNWYMEPSEINEMDAIIEFGGVSDYSQICYAPPLDEAGYGSLWEETYDTIMYN